MIVNGRVSPRPRVWMATVDSSHRPAVGSSAQNDRSPGARVDMRQIVPQATDTGRTNKVGPCLKQ